MIKRFKDAWKGIGAIGLHDPSNMLVALYRGSDIFYHNLSHIESCLREFDSARELIENPVDLEIAIWFHDAIYHSKAKDNEEKSAEFARALLLTSGVLEKRAEIVKDLILDTKHLEVPKSLDGKFIVDIDLSIFGQPQLIYDEYSKNIRKEYFWINEEDYKKGRVGVLGKFLERPFIYHTDFFREKYEEKARKNLAREIEKLKL